MQHNNTASDAVEKAVLQTLAYFDLFEYPLTESEIRSFLGIEARSDEILQILSGLSQRALVFRRSDFYSLQNDPQRIARRLKGNRLAGQQMARAYRRGRLIGRFPFVRSVMISGSLSKGFMSPTGDYDYFVITSPGRLWVARFFLTAFKRIFLFNRHKRFCVNYLISEDCLEIAEKNLFTATELATLIPVYGNNYRHLLYKSNLWARTYLPNQFRNLPPCTEVQISFGKRLLEGLFNGNAGDRLDRYSQRLFWKKWVLKYRPALAEEDFNLAFKSTRSVSKLHPQNYQRTVLNRLHHRLSILYSEVSALQA